MSITLEEAQAHPDLYAISEAGPIRDRKTGRIVGNPGGGRYAITQQNASAYARRRAERRRQVIAEAANAAVERGDYRERYDDMAFVAAIAEAQYIKATTPDDPKSTAAANFLLEQAGISAKQHAEQGPETPTADVVGAVAGLVGQVRGLLDDVLSAAAARDEDNDEKT
jgi:hypothetical protein